MFILKLNDNCGDVVSRHDVLFETEYAAITAGVVEVKAGCLYHLYIEETDKPMGRGYAHFIPNSKVLHYLNVFNGDVQAVANLLDANK